MVRLSHRERSIISAGGAALAFSYRRDDDRRQITAAVSGTATEADLIGIIDRQAAEHTWTYCLLFDERAAHPEITPEALRRVYERVGQVSAVHGKRGRVAILTAPMDSSIAREWEPFGARQPHQVDVFTDPELAQYWLDASEADLRR